jgi:GNAT superfamily N-acetyltransferase
VSLSEEFCMVDGHPFDRGRVTAALATLLADDKLGEVWVVSGEHGLEGYAVTTWGYSIESGGRDALLDEMYVSKPGSGTGSTLLEAVISAVRERGLARIFLETEAANAAARRFYDRHGFSVEDSVWMALDLR